MARTDTQNDSSRSAARTGREPAVEHFLDRYIGNGIHLFLSLLAVIILAAALIAGVEVVIRDFPPLWLVAIAAELGLLLLFHRASAAIEVIIFVVARKMVTPAISGIELLLGTAALAGLVIVRFYFLRERTT